MLELPEWAESRHNGYNRPPRTFAEMGERLRVACKPVTEAFRQLGQAFVIGFEKGMQQAVERKQQTAVEGSIDYKLVLPEIHTTSRGWYELFAQYQPSQEEEVNE